MGLVGLLFMWGTLRPWPGGFFLIIDLPGKPYQHAMLYPMRLEMAIHHFDLVRFMFSAEPFSGWVHERNPRRSPYRMGGAGDEHSLAVTEKMATVHLYGIMPPGGRFGYLYKRVDPTLEDRQKSRQGTQSQSDGSVVRLAYICTR
jgi:hypothetical protein